MYFSKKIKEPVEEIETNIWMCSDESCTCWKREDLSFEENPVCPICSSNMVRDTKMLPPLSNFHSNHS